MRVPVLSSVSSQGKVLDVVTINVIVQSQENANACLCKNRMDRLKLNVIVGDIFDGLCQPFRHQTFLDGKMRKLNDT
jgi:hypothetical protein